jgi:hypothetical protein
MFKVLAYLAVDVSIRIQNRFIFQIVIIVYWLYAVYIRSWAARKISSTEIY